MDIIFDQTQINLYPNQRIQKKVNEDLKKIARR